MRQLSEFSDSAVIILFIVVAILSFLTGILNIGMTSVQGPLSDFLPEWIQQAAGFTGALTGFLMLAIVPGLRNRLSKAWIFAMTLLPLTLVQGFIQSSLVSLPLILLSAFAIPSLFSRRKWFNQSSELSPTQLAALSAVVGVQLYGTVGTYALQRGFNQNMTFLDAFYFSIVTSSTVGYGEIHAVSPTAKAFTITLIVMGTASFAAAIALLLGPLIESKLAGRFKKMEKEIIEEIE